MKKQRQKTLQETEKYLQKHQIEYSVIYGYRDVQGAPFIEIDEKTFNLLPSSFSDNPYIIVVPEVCDYDYSED
jgi:hypothetical protein